MMTRSRRPGSPPVLPRNPHRPVPGPDHAPGTRRRRHARRVHRPRPPRRRARTPKYLNTPQTATYKKSHLLFGLYQARPDLAQWGHCPESGFRAIPVIVEGAFDAIAVSIADPGRHAGLAPCGTALTSQQAAQLSQAADLPRTGILVAFDSDTAGRKAAIRAHGILRPLTGRLQSAALDGKDPAEILQRDGPAALRIILREHRQPLSALLIDASIEQWGRRLDDTSGPLLAMRSAASLIASLLPDDTASQIRDITAGRELQTTDDLLRPVDNPEIPQIARILPADTATRSAGAGKLASTHRVLTEVANATTRNTARGHQPRARAMTRAAGCASQAPASQHSFRAPSPQASPELPGPAAPQPPAAVGSPLALAEPGFPISQSPSTAKPGPRLPWTGPRLSCWDISRGRQFRPGNDVSWNAGPAQRRDTRPAAVGHAAPAGRAAGATDPISRSRT